jgi:4-amino-4-deoxy-L-arabinose transferase-like glycosyltransferase
MHSPLPQGQASHPQTLALLLAALVFFAHVFVALLMLKISGPSAFLSPDTGHYLEAARALLHGSFSIASFPEFFRTPGYPLLLVPAMASQQILAVALLENFILATFAAWLVWRIASYLFPGTKAAMWAVLLYCFEPVGFLYSEQLLSDTAFTAAFLLFVWLFLRFLDSPTYARLASSAIALAGATYVRPASLYLPFCLAAVLLVFPRGLGFRGRLARAIAFTLVFQLLLAPWVARNAVLADYPGFSSAGDWNLYFCSAAAIQAKLDHRGFAETRVSWGANNSLVYFQRHPEQRTWTRGRVARAWGSEAQKMISAHWMTYLPIHAKGSVTVMLDPGVSEMLKVFRLYPDQGGLLARVQNEGYARATLWLLENYPVTMFLLPLLAAQMALYYALAVLGLRRAAPAVKATLVVIVFYFVLISGTPAAVARYRVPLMPLACVCAGAALAQYQAKRAKARSVAATQ